MERWQKITTLAVTCTLLSFSGVAGQQEPVSTAAIASKDTSGQQGTTPILLDPKTGFKNLFTTVDLGNGVKAEKLNPRAISFVQDYIAKNGKGLRKMKDWGKPYFDMMDAILSRHGVPQQLKYLAVIESGLRYNAKSWAGAVGPWAFMPAAAAEYGLKVTRYSDERLDYYKSTHAAASLLTDLYARYGDWLLVVAAYNGGPGNVDKAIRKSGSRDFWTLQYNLPNESMNHVKKFIATHYIMEGEGGITTATKEEVKNMLLTGNSHLTTEEINASRQQIITGRYNAAVLARHIEMDIALFNRYNPGFDNEVAVNGHYQLRLPHEKMDVFLAKKPAILYESLQLLLKPLHTGSR